MYKVCFFILMLCSYTNIFAQKVNKPVAIILDTDMGPDYDDVGAITILHALADKGEATILATMASTKYEGVAGVLNAFNTYFKRPNIPVGIPKSNAVTMRDWQHWTDTVLAKYPHKIKTNSQAPDAVQLYRKILATQPDHSVTIVTIGFLTNLANLMVTKGDKYSPLTGRQLMVKKVRLLVSMAGKYPSGYEFNIKTDSLSSIYVYKHLQVPVIFSGFEIGEKIKAGLPLIHNAAINNDPVKDVFRISIPQSNEDAAGRSSWDETSVLIAIKGYSQWYTLHHGHITIAMDGSNNWDNKGTGQAYLVEKVSPTKVQQVINSLIMYQPE